MKKIPFILILSTTALGLTAFGLANWKNLDAIQVETSITNNVETNRSSMDATDARIFTDFIHGVGPRFGPIKKEDLGRFTSVYDFLPKELHQKITSFQSVEVVVLENDQETEIRQIGYSDRLNAAQLQLLQSSGYSTNLKILAYYQEKRGKTGTLVNSYASPHLTIVPHTQATYESGKEVFLKYLREHSSVIHSQQIDIEKVQPAKLFFTVTEKGSIENIRLEKSSGYPEMDKKIRGLLTKAPGKWIPAQNKNGEKVSQELVISFGAMGC